MNEFFLIVSANDMLITFFCFEYISRIVAQDYRKDPHKAFKHRIHQEINCGRGNLSASLAVGLWRENEHLLKQQVEAQLRPSTPLKGLWK